MNASSLPFPEQAVSLHRVRRFLRRSKGVRTRLLFLLCFLGAAFPRVLAQAPPPGTTPFRNAEFWGLDVNLFIALHNGELQYRATDISIPGRGPEFEFTRFYGHQRGHDGPLGVNWSHNWEQSVWESQGLLHHFDGSRLETDVYAPDTSHASLYTCTTPGVYRKARKVGSKWEIRDRDGTICRFDVPGQLESMTDRHQNTFTCSYGNGLLSTIQDPLGRLVTIAYDTNDRMETITDFDGRQWQYGHGATGNLESVTSPSIVGTPVNPVTGQHNDFPAGKTTAYGYDANDRLHSIKYPREAMAPGGNPVIEAVTFTNDQVTSAQVGGHGVALSYGPGQGVEVSETEVIDRRGFKTWYGFSASGHATRVEREKPSGPTNYVTRYSFNAHGEVLENILPNGEKYTFTYRAISDLFQQGNVAVEKHIPDPASSGTEEYRRRRFFEPVYNQRVSSNLAGETIILDYQEGDPATNGLNQLVNDWDIALGGTLLNLPETNGDGLTQLGGNVIWRESPLINQGTPEETKKVFVFTYDSFGRTITETTAEGTLTVYSYDPVSGQLSLIILDADPSAAPNAGTQFWVKPPEVAHVEATTSFEFDNRGNIISETNPRGVKTEYLVNAHNQVVKTTIASTWDSVRLDPVLQSFVNLGYSHLVAPAYQLFTQYDENGNVSRIDRENRNAGDPANPWISVSYQYDLENRVIREESEISSNQIAVTQSFYGPDGNRIKQIHPEQNMDLWTYDERDYVKTFARGASSEPADENVDSIITFRRDDNGRLISADGPEDLNGDGNKERTLFAYDGRSRLVETTDPVGTVTKQVMGKNGFLKTRVFQGTAGGPSPLHNDVSQNVLLLKQGQTFDEIGRLLENKLQLMPVGGVPTGFPYVPPTKWIVQSTQVYDRDDLVIEETDATNAARFFTYDGIQRVLTHTDDAGNQSEYEYDAGGNLVREMVHETSGYGGGLGETKVFVNVYDGLNRLIRRTNTLGETEYYRHDSRGNVVGQADARSTVLGNDPLGVLSGPLNLPGNTRRYVHDGLNRLIRSATDVFPGGLGDGQLLWDAGFDPSLMMTGATREIVSTFEVDKNGNVTKVTSGSQGDIEFEYDSQDRLTKKTFPDGSYFGTTYWKDGRVKSHALHEGTSGNPLFRELQFTYDGAGRMVTQAVSLPIGSEIEGSSLQTWQYNGLDLPTLLTDDNGGGEFLSSSVTRFYDSLGRILQEVQNGKEVNAQFDDVGNRTDLWYPGAARHVEFQFDSLHRLDQILDGGQQVAKYGYLGPDRLGDIQLGEAQGNYVARRNFADPPASSGLVSGYDEVGRPVHLKHENGSGGLLGRIRHVFDRIGNRLSEERLNGQTGAELSDSVVYGSLSRVEQVDRNIELPNPPEKTEDYIYDDDSAWDSLTMQCGVEQPSNYRFHRNSVGGYDSIEDLEEGTHRDLGHDLAGNRTSDFWFEYFYDAYDRLVRIRFHPDRGLSDTVVRFSYDALGRRIQRRSWEGHAQEKKVNYFYEGEHIVEEYNKHGVLRAQYVHGDVIDEVLQMARDVDQDGILERFYYLANSLGNVVALTDDSGTVVERYDYDSFGAPLFLAPDGTEKTDLCSEFKNPFLFTGREYDPETAEGKAFVGVPLGYFDELTRPTGHYYFRARYADPGEGRFVSRDPLAMGSNLPAADPSLLLNRVVLDGLVESPYVFLSNNPQNLIDPMGLQPPPSNPPGYVPGRGGILVPSDYVRPPEPEAPKPSRPGASGRGGGQKTSGGKATRTVTGRWAKVSRTVVKGGGILTLADIYQETLYSFGVVMLGEDPEPGEAADAGCGGLIWHWTWGKLLSVPFQEIPKTEPKTGGVTPFPHQESCIDVEMDLKVIGITGDHRGGCPKTNECLPGVQTGPYVGRRTYPATGGMWPNPGTSVRDLPPRGGVGGGTTPSSRTRRSGADDPTGGGSGSEARPRPTSSRPAGTTPLGFFSCQSRDWALGTRCTGDDNPDVPDGNGTGDPNGGGDDSFGFVPSGDRPGSRVGSLAALVMEGKVRLQWAAGSPLNGRYSIHRIDAESPVEIATGYLDGEELITVLDEEGLHSSQYLLTIEGRFGQKWVHGPFRPLGSVSEETRTSLAALEASPTSQITAKGPEDERQASGWVSLLGAVLLSLVACASGAAVVLRPRSVVSS